jgi:hypothetical protein
LNDGPRGARLVVDLRSWFLEDPDVTIEVSSQAIADDLVSTLRSMGCIALRRGERWVEITSGWPVRDDASPRHFDSYLRAWELHCSGWAVRVG